MAKILLVDDEPDVLLIVSERLKRNGHEVECAADGVQAIQRSKEDSFDLLILDIRMPVHTGYEVCEFVRKSEKNAKTPVILASAFPEEEKKWRQSQANAFLPKPFETAQLVDVVDRLLKEAA